MSIEVYKIPNLDDQEWDEVIAQSGKKMVKNFKIQIYWAIIFRDLARALKFTDEELFKEIFMDYINSSPENIKITQRIIDSWKKYKEGMIRSV